MTDETFEQFRPSWEDAQESKLVKEVVKNALNRGASRRDIFGYVADLVTQVYEEEMFFKYNNQPIPFREENRKEKYPKRGKDFTEKKLLKLSNNEFNNQYTSFLKGISENKDEIKSLLAYNFMKSISLERQIIKLQKYELYKILQNYFCRDISIIIVNSL